MVGAVGVGVGELVLDAMGLDDVADVVSSARLVLDAMRLLGAVERQCRWHVADVVSSARAVDSGRAGGKCSRRVQVCVVATLLWW